MKVRFSIPKKDFTEIKSALEEEHNNYYGKPCGHRTVMTQTGELVCGYAETENGFRWLRSSGTYIEFSCGFIYAAGTRHSINEFLHQFFSKEELREAKIHKIESREPERGLGDTF